MTFSVLADGRTLVATPAIRGGQAAVPVDVDVCDAQAVDLRVVDAANGTGNDHGHWAMPALTSGWSLSADGARPWRLRGRTDRRPV
ncbi:NPCBM/NEW2 domain-containing protein [Streptomyces sediminimaris]|uniref:NPCBM/NEW2 domain-containing protein n=1 Tax=Streptomyces sediminimaris TaxID=3383721 RepID=UPI003999EAAD